MGALDGIREWLGRVIADLLILSVVVLLILVILFLCHCLDRLEEKRKDRQRRRYEEED